MLKVTWRNLVARKLRLLLSAFAIILGVSFVSGTLIFSDALTGAFDDIVEGSTADVEIAYEGAGDFDSQQDSRTLPASLVKELEELPEAGGVYPSVFNPSTYVLDAEGELVGGNGPPGLAFNATGAVAVTGKQVLTLLDGQLPVGPKEVALEEGTAERAGYEIGDTVDLVTTGTPSRVEAELTGLVEFGSGGTNGATIAVFDVETMQELFYGGRDVYSSIALNTADGTSQQELADAAEPLLPDGVQARTGDDVVAVNKESLEENLGFIERFLLAFAGISLFVGIFLIVNTFSILVAQRGRELALLRALGASRRQVTRAVLIEALAVGLIGATAGLLGGWLLAQGLKALFGAIGLDLSEASFAISWSTVVTSYAVGVVVTLVAGYFPARRAAKVPPVAALRDDVALPEQALYRRAVIAVLLILVGAAGCVIGFNGEGDSALALLVVGFLVVLVGAALFSPLLARPVIRVFGIAYRRLFGAVGALAEGNSIRNPRRTAATASALMVGLTIVAMASIFSQSLSKSFEENINDSLTSQFVISNVIGQPFSADVAEQVRELDDVASVAEFRQAMAEVDGTDVFLGAVDPREFSQALLLPTESGSMAEFGPGGLVLGHNQAEQQGLAVGDEVTLEFQGGDVTVTVAAVLVQGAGTPADWLVTPETLTKGGLEPLDSYVFVNAAPEADLGTLRSELDQIVEELPTVTVKDPQGFVDEQIEQLNFFLYVIYGLLALSVVIAVLGVVNTLALSVIERTREVGLLRAVGVSRRQIRTMIRLEAIVISVFGALLGVILGGAFGIALVRALRDDGIGILVIPWVTMLALIVTAALVGVLAAVFPARRAARLDVLKAITSD